MCRLDSVQSSGRNSGNETHLRSGKKCGVRVSGHEQYGLLMNHKTLFVISLPTKCEREYCYTDEYFLY